MLGAMLFLVLLQPSHASIDPQTKDETSDQCTEVDKEIQIIAEQIRDGSMVFNPSEINVELDSCVKINLKNNDDHPYDFTISHSENDLMDETHKKFALNDTTIVSINVKFPNEDYTVTFFAWRVGYRKAGLEGKFIVGQGSKKAPGYEFPLAIFAFISIIILRKKRANH